RNEDLARHGLDDGQDQVAVVGRGRDVEEGELVGALFVIAPGDLHRVAGVGQVDEVHALYHPPGVDVQEGDDAAAQTRPAGLRVGRSHASASSPAVAVGGGTSWSASDWAAAKSRVPSYRLRPRIAPSTPSSATSHRARMSSSDATPPEAMTGMRTCCARRTVASMLTPESMPSRPMSV